MGSEIVYRRYRWTAVVIGFVLVSAGAPVVEWTHERLDEHSIVAHPLPKHDHSPEGPSPMKVYAAGPAVTGTATVPSTDIWSPTTPPGVTFRALDL